MSLERRIMKRFEDSPEFDVKTALAGLTYDALSQTSLEGWQEFDDVAKMDRNRLQEEFDQLEAHSKRFPYLRIQQYGRDDAARRAAYALVVLKEREKNGPKLTQSEKSSVFECIETLKVIRALDKEELTLEELYHEIEFENEERKELEQRAIWVNARMDLVKFAKTLSSPRKIGSTMIPRWHGVFSIRDGEYHFAGLDFSYFHDPNTILPEEKPIVVGPVTFDTSGDLVNVRPDRRLLEGEYVIWRKV